MQWRIQTGMRDVFPTGIMHTAIFARENASKTNQNKSKTSNQVLFDNIVYCTMFDKLLQSEAIP